MPRYYTMTASGPVFQIKIPAGIAKHLSFSMLSAPISGADKVSIRVEAMRLATTARKVFDMLKNIECGVDLKSITREQLSKLVVEGAEGVQSGKNHPETLSSVMQMLDAGVELFKSDVVSAAS